MLHATAMSTMSPTTLSIASIVIAANSMALPISFLFGTPCQGWEQPMHLKGFLVKKTEIIWWESRQEITSYAKRGNGI